MAKHTQTTTHRKPTTQTPAKAAPAAPVVAAPQPLGADLLQQAVGDPRNASPTAILTLQRRYGNRAVQRLVSNNAQRALAEPRAGGEVDAGVQQDIDRARGGGQPLHRGIASQFGRSLGVDLSGVKVHTGDKADQLNRSLSATAFTTGRDVFFQKDAYNPNSTKGRSLLAHELTHVVQQSAARPNPKVQRKLRVGPAADRYEREAEHVAAKIGKMPLAPKPAAGQAPSPARVDGPSVAQRTSEVIQREDNEDLPLAFRVLGAGMDDPGKMYKYLAPGKDDTGGGKRGAFRRGAQKVGAGAAAVGTGLVTVPLGIAGAAGVAGAQLGAMPFYGAGRVAQSAWRGITGQTGQPGPDTSKMNSTQANKEYFKTAGIGLAATIASPIALPGLGLAALGKYGGRKAAQYLGVNTDPNEGGVKGFVKNIGYGLASPFLGLAAGIKGIHTWRINRSNDDPSLGAEHGLEVYQRKLGDVLGEMEKHYNKIITYADIYEADVKLLQHKLIPNAESEVLLLEAQVRQAEGGGDPAKTAEFQQKLVAAKAKVAAAKADLVKSSKWAGDATTSKQKAETELQWIKQKYHAIGEVLASKPSLFSRDKSKQREYEQRVAAALTGFKADVATANTKLVEVAAERAKLKHYKHMEEGFIKTGRHHTLGRHIMKSIGTGILSAAIAIGTLGVVGREQYKEGARSKSRFVFVWTKWMRDWEQLKALIKHKPYGMVATWVYAVLKGIGTMLIRPLRDMFGALGTLAGLLSLIPGAQPFTLPISVAAMGLAFKLTLVKAGLDSLLTLWNLIAMGASSDATKSSMIKGQTADTGFSALGSAASLAAPGGGVNIRHGVDLSPMQEFNLMGQTGSLSSGQLHSLSNLTGDVTPTVAKSYMPFLPTETPVGNLSTKLAGVTPIVEALTDIPKDPLGFEPTSRQMRSREKQKRNKQEPAKLKAQAAKRAADLQKQLIAINAAGNGVKSRMGKVKAFFSRKKTGAQPEAPQNDVGQVDQASSALQGTGEPITTVVGILGEMQKA